MLKEAHKILGHNRFAPLLETLGGNGDDAHLDATTLDEISNSFTTVSRKVAKEMGVLPIPSKPSLQRRGQRPTLSRRTARLTRRREKEKRRFLEAQAAGSADVAEKRERFQDFRRLAATAAARDRRRCFLRYVRRGVEIAGSSDLRSYWRWLRTTAGGRRGIPAPMTPVRDSDGTLLVHASDILRRWTDHYWGLCSDVTGHSRDRAFWSDVPPTWWSTRGPWASGFLGRGMWRATQHVWE